MRKSWMILAVCAASPLVAAAATPAPATSATRGAAAPAEPGAAAAARPAKAAQTAAAEPAKPSEAAVEPAPAAATEPASAPEAGPGLPFAPGEKLSYTVTLLGIRAGEADLKVESAGGDAWRLSATGRTVGASDSLFGLRQTASCTVDLHALQPKVCLFDTTKRGALKRREVRFDPANGMVRERTLEEGTRKERELKFADGMGDVQEALSGLYLLRRDLPPEGQVVKFRALRKNKPISVEARRIGEEQVETPAGAFLCTVVDLRIVEAVDKDAARHARVWFTADGRRVPVKVSVDAPVGSLEAELTAAQGTVGGSLARR